MHGNFFQYHRNGRVSVKGKYNYGEKIGKWTWRDDLGIIDSIYSYDRGLLNGSSKIFNDGELVIRQKYFNGKHKRFKIDKRYRNQYFSIYRKILFKNK